MAIYARATKTSLTKFLRSKGIDVPTTRLVDFRPMKYSAMMFWRDSKGYYRKCWYSFVVGKPCCLVDDEAIGITMAEVMQFGLYREEKEKAPVCAGTQTKA